MIAKLVFPFMIEITTGIVFLMSSLYGAGQPASAAIAAAPQTTGETEIAIAPSSVKDPKDMEAYLRDTYADTPLLVDIARCESTFRHYGKNGTIIRGKANADDVGVMQINELYHKDRAEKLGMDIYTIEGNVAYAKFLYEKYGSKPWSSSAPCWSKASGDLAKK